MKRDYEKELHERVDYIRKLLESSGAKGHCLWQFGREGFCAGGHFVPEGH